MSTTRSRRLGCDRRARHPHVPCWPKRPACYRTGALFLLSCRDRPLSLSLILLCPQRLPFVVGAFALCHGDLDLGVTVLEVHRQRHDGVTALLGLLDQLGDLRLVQEQLAPTPRRMVVPGGLGVFRYVHPFEPDLPIANRRKTVNQRGPARA